MIIIVIIIVITSTTFFVIQNFIFIISYVKIYETLCTEIVQYRVFIDEVNI